VHSSTQNTLSAWTLLAQADAVVKLVMLVLFLSSILSWSVIWDKVRKMRAMWHESALAFRALVGKDFEDLSEQSIFGKMATVAQQEKARLSGYGKTLWSMRMGRLDNLLSSLSGKTYADLSRHMGLLASIGSSAVFVGLFGTVWGIMNSFRSIASSQNTSLSVVAPGISEALFVTAAGLLVAIPAMVAYNRIMDSMNRFMENVDCFAQEMLAWVSDE
jgi:biopolymer transport protein TolQ